MLMYPMADVPVVQLSIQQSLDPVHHVQMGEAISPLRKEGILLIGSGGAIHPLGDPYASLGNGARTEDWAVEFDDWLAPASLRMGTGRACSSSGRVAPYARRAHTRGRIITCRFWQRSVRRVRVRGGRSSTAAGSGISSWQHMSSVDP
jgi:4,5-DOPA dioxygenase extradiol